MQIKYKKTLSNVPDLTMPKLKGDVGFDLSIVELIKSEEVSFIAENDYGNHYKSIIEVQREWFDTGIAVKPPNGYYFEIVPRSSLSKTDYILSNSVGIIDEEYRGSIKVCLYNLGFPTKQKELPLRLLQLVLRKNESRKIESIEEVNDFESTERNEQGFGSTG